MNFFHSMGMKQKEQKKILSFEICSVANIALGTGICLALLYVMTYLHWYDAIGEKISTTFWRLLGLKLRWNLYNYSDSCAEIICKVCEQKNLEEKLRRGLLYQILNAI